MNATPRIPVHTGSGIVHTFHSILDHFIQPLIDGIIHVVPFRDLTPFVFSVTYYSITINTNSNSKQVVPGHHKDTTSSCLPIICWGRFNKTLQH